MFTVEIVRSADAAKFVYSNDPSVAVNPMPGFFVFFEPEDIFFHYGVTTYAAYQAFLAAGGVKEKLGAYTAAIYKDGVLQPRNHDGVIAPYDLPFHDWQAEWAHELTPNTIVRDKDKIVADLLMFQLGQIGPKVPTKPTNKYTPMGAGGVTTAMGTTGERSDIGLIADWTAWFLMYGDPTAMIEAARGMRTFGDHYFDERTGKLYSNVTFPKGTIYSNQLPPVTDPAYIVPPPSGALFGLEEGHFPEAAFIAACATMQPRFLRTVQASEILSYIWSDYYWGATPKHEMLGIGQTRLLAWGLKKLLQAYVATLLFERAGKLPAWALPSSEFKQLLDWELEFLVEGYMTDPAIQTFRCYPLEDMVPIWQQDYLGEVLGLAALFLPEWRPLYLWDLGNLLPRVDNTGWGPGMPSAYRVQLGPGMITHQQGPRHYQAQDFFPTWKAVFDNLLAQAGSGSADYHVTVADATALKADPLNGGVFIPTDMYYNYLVYARLAIAKTLDDSGIVNVSGAYAQFPAAYTRIRDMLDKKAASGAIPARVSFIPVKLSNSTPDEEPPMPNVDLGPLTSAADALVALAPQVQAAVDTLEAQIVDLKAQIAAAPVGVDTTALAAVVTKLTGVKTALAAAVTDAATPG